jgi:hypothetical protein
MFIRLAERMGHDVALAPDAVQVVATSAQATLFAAQQTRGRGWCSGLIAKNGSEYVVDCHPSGDVPLTLSSAAWVRPGTDAPYLISGRVSPSVTRLEAVDPAGTTTGIEINPGGYFLFEPPNQTALRLPSITIRAINTDGTSSELKSQPPVEAALNGESRMVSGRAISAEAVSAEVRTLRPRAAAAGPTIQRTTVPVGADGRFNAQLPDGTSSIVFLKLEASDGSTLFEGEIPADAYWSALKNST